MHVNAITLVAICHKDAHGNYETSAYMRLQLEYVYSQILLTLTDYVQIVLQQNASLDLRNLLGPASETATKSLLNSMGMQDGPAPFLLASALSLYPVPSICRQRSANVLRNAGTGLDNTVFGILFSGSYVLALIQPDYVPHFMRMADLHVLLHFVNRQQALLSSELWLPVCLPQFCSSGFLYCYTTCLDAPGKLILAFVSTQGTTEQFESFRVASMTVRRQLGIRSQSASMVTIDGVSSGKQGSADATWEQSDVNAAGDVDNNNNDSNNGADVINKNSNKYTIDAENVMKDERTGEADDSKGGSNDALIGDKEDSDDDDDDYVDVARVGDASVVLESPPSNECMFLKDLRPALQPASRMEAMRGYLASLSIQYFLFRYDLVYPTSKKHQQSDRGTSGRFSQCIRSELFDAFLGLDLDTAMLKFQQLYLRLRLGSSSDEAVIDAYSKLRVSSDCSDSTGASLSWCSATSLLQSSSDAERSAYMVDSEYVYVGMNGKEYEL
jgi:Second Longin domain of FUZ, MON1 and HPS1